MPHTNALANETSPYLLQHAHNPVNWQPWGKEALAQAKREDKPIIVSIGYAACHWCHVMEHESFEDSAVAAVMNEHFVCIKVDREERPDVDQIYMDAVQAMGQQGGWPLNVFLTSEAKPFYGGTYFPPANWTKICENVAQAYEQQRDKIEQSAAQITNGIASSILDQFTPNETNTFDPNTLTTAFLALEKDFDHRHGGFGGAPKFPMPCNLSFMMRYYNYSNQESALAMTTKTLDEMAYGGIYDQAGGGFARYSTDARWFAPHFEKMLYDNGQLISNYAQAYRLTQKELYKDVVYQTVSFVERELMSPEGGFYSSLDADSEGIEGKFYCWDEEELKRLLGADFSLFKAYYHTYPHGNWEEKNILYRTSSDEEFAKHNDLDLILLQQKVAHWKQALMKVREHRIRPGLDDKILASWNGWMLNGLCDAYRSFSDERFLALALKNATFISENMISEGKVFHNHKNGVTTLDGYLEDYAALIKAFTNLYQVTFDEKWLHLAKTLTDYTIVHFYDEKEKLFFFTDDQSEALIARKKEIFDNVIPASNSVMAENLHFLGLYFDHEAYTQKSNAMLQQVVPLLERNARYTTFWASVYRLKVAPTIEIAISGSNFQSIRSDFQQREIGNAIFMGMGENERSSLPLLAEKQSSEETLIYICYNKTCQFPVKEIERAIEQIK